MIWEPASSTFAKIRTFLRQIQKYSYTRSLHTTNLKLSESSPRFCRDFALLDLTHWWPTISQFQTFTLSQFKALTVSNFHHSLHRNHLHLGSLLGAHPVPGGESVLLGKLLDLRIAHLAQVQIFMGIILIKIGNDYFWRGSVTIIVLIVTNLINQSMIMNMSMVIMMIMIITVLSSLPSSCTCWGENFSSWTW